MTDSGRLLVRPHAPDSDGCLLHVTPQTAGWLHVGFQLFQLHDRQSVVGGEIGRETCLVILSGAAEVSVDGVDCGAIGGRRSVFEDAAPGAVYAPAGARFKAVARGHVELALCSAPGRPGRSARVIDSGEMSREVRGRGTNTRYVRNVLHESQPADSLLVVEVITPGGHWSSYPPHKHDSSVEGEETAL